MSIKQGGNTIAGSVGQYPLNKKNITNCITYIPQDIKLELNNGTLILKAGSKVYVPNGAGVFNPITLSADNSITGSGSNVSYLVCCNESGLMTYRPLKNCVSGAGATTTSGFAYNITTNEIYYYNSASVPTTKSSLPICIVSTNSNGVFSTIDQVFNGFGYIGSTVFVLPGVKGLIPDGRNADGSLKNIETGITNVQIISGGGSDQKNIYTAVRPGGTLGLNGEFGYDEKNNITYNGVNIEPQFLIAKFDNSGGKITNFTPKTVFHAVNYCDADFVVDFQRPTLANNYTWYRKYKSGWVEQGGRGVTSSEITYVTLPVQMRSVAYTATGGVLYSSASEGTVGFQFIKRTTQLGIGARWNGSFNNGLAVDWQVSGMAAN